MTARGAAADRPTSTSNSVAASATVVVNAETQSYEAMAGTTPSVGQRARRRLQADDAAQRGRDPSRTGGVGPERDRDLAVATPPPTPSSNPPRCTRARRGCGTARMRRPGADQAGRELIEVGLADARPRRHRAAADRRSPSRPATYANAGQAGGGGHAGDVDVVLDREGMPAKGRSRPAATGRRPRRSRARSASGAGGVIHALSRRPTRPCGRAARRRRSAGGHVIGHHHEQRSRRRHQVAARAPPPGRPCRRRGLRDGRSPSSSLSSITTASPGATRSPTATRTRAHAAEQRSPPRRTRRRRAAPSRGRPTAPARRPVRRRRVNSPAAPIAPAPRRTRPAARCGRRRCRRRAAVTNAAVVGEGSVAVLDAELEPARSAASARSSSSSSAPTGYNRMLVEEAQQPRRPRERSARAPVRVPHRHGAADELVAARALHAVDAEVRAADADRVLGRPVRAGLYFVVTSRWRGSSGVATGAPRYTSPRPSTRYAASNTMRCTSSTESRPLMRRMNSMFHGHQGASARTDAHVALDRLAGGRVVPRQRQVHDPARRRLTSSSGGQLVFGVREQLDDSARTCARRRVELHLQRADPRRHVDDAVERRLVVEPRAERVRRGGGARGRASSARTRRAGSVALARGT